MITLIIFSKNRPLQLDLCIKSIKQNFKSCNKIIVIYKADEEYESSYQTLKQDYQDIDFWNQINFLTDINCAISCSENEYISFFTDDCFFYKEMEIPVEDLEQIMKYKEIACFSMRMGLNINLRSDHGEVFSDKPILIYDYMDYIIIPKTAHLYGSYWSYSLSVDGHIFRKNDISKMVNELIHIRPLYSWNDNPNDFESALQRFWTTTPNFIAAEKISSVINSPNNRVQDSHKDNRYGDMYNYTSKDLLNEFLNGKRIDLSKIDIENVCCPHTEINILKYIT